MLSEAPSSEGEDGLAGVGGNSVRPRKGSQSRGSSRVMVSALGKFALSAQCIPARQRSNSTAMVTKITLPRPGQGPKTVLMWDQESTPALSYHSSPAWPCTGFLHPCIRRPLAKHQRSYK